MMSKYSKFGINTFNIFVYENDNKDDDLAINIYRLFLRNRQAKVTTIKEQQQYLNVMNDKKLLCINRPMTATFRFSNNNA